MENDLLFRKPVSNKVFLNRTPRPQNQLSGCSQRFILMKSPSNSYALFNSSCKGETSLQTITLAILAQFDNRLIEFTQRFFQLLIQIGAF